MDTILYVFSGTGNSLAAAKKLKDNLLDAEIQSMPYLLKQDQEIISSASCVGFVFPCYFDDAPQLVRDFISK